MANLTLPRTPFNGKPDPTGIFSPLVPIGVSFSGTARSIDFGGTANQIGFDNITFGKTPQGLPSTLIATGSLAPNIIAAVDNNKVSMQAGLFESLVGGNFIDGALGFDRTKETYVLVHGWNGVGSFFTNRQEDSLDKLWVTDMAKEIKQKDSSANILAWNWTKYADSLVNDFIPVNQVNLQAHNLAEAFGQLYSGFDEKPGGVQFLGHSLGAAIVANAANFLKPADPKVDRLTLFDAPENLAAKLLGGRVNLDTVLPRANSNMTVENYIADGLTSSGTLGYGISYGNRAANTLLLGYEHFGDGDAESPMDWYKPTVNPGSTGFDQISGFSESDARLQRRYNQVYANQNPNDEYDLTKWTGVTYLKTLALDAWHDLSNLADSVVKVIVGSAEIIADVTVTVAGKVADGLIMMADAVTLVTSTLYEWASTGVASFREGWGLQQTSSSPSYAYTTLHIPETADSIYFEFIPEVWGEDDSYIILFDDEVLYRIDGEFFENAWMDTGFMDISRWAGRDVLLTIGLLSEEAGHQITTGGFGFTSRVALTSASVPEPGALLLLGTGLLGLIRVRRKLAA